GLLHRLLATRLGAVHATALTLVLASSLYVFPAGVWLLPDNAGWLGVLAVLGLSLRVRYRARLVVFGSLLLVPLVLTRQIHLWAAAAVWTAAWMGPELGGVWRIFERWPRRLRFFAIAVLASLPAFAAVGAFVWVWGGLVPPMFQGAYHGANPATPALTLSVAGLLSPAFAPWIVPGLRDLWRGGKGWLVLALGFGLVAALVPSTTFDPEAGRISGIWTAASKLPVLMGRTSPVVLILAPVGAVAVASVLARATPRSGWILLGALVGFVTAQSATHEAWQRYHEPCVLIWFALAIAEAPVERRSIRAIYAVLPLAIAAVMALATGLRIAGERSLPVLEPELFERAVSEDPLDGRPPPADDAGADGKP
ncbi:MAG: hypothetical protein AAGI17_09855, partial [Planctomycetota bacterium]